MTLKHWFLLVISWWFLYMTSWLLVNIHPYVPWWNALDKSATKDMKCCCFGVDYAFWSFYSPTTTETGSEVESLVREHVAAEVNNIKSASYCSSNEITTPWRELHTQLSFWSRAFNEASILVKIACCNVPPFFPFESSTCPLPWWQRKHQCNDVKNSMRQIMIEYVLFY